MPSVWRDSFGSFWALPIRSCRLRSSWRSTVVGRSYSPARRLLQCRMNKTLALGLIWRLRLYDKLTGRDAEITYGFDDLELHVPSSASADAEHARWKINGTVRISTRKSRNTSKLGADVSSLPAEIHANLDCVVDGKSFSVRSTGRQTVVEVPDVATGLRLLRLGSPRGYFWGSVHRRNHLLDSAYHQAELQVRGRTVGSLGHGVGSRTRALLGLPNIKLKPIGITSAIVSRQPGRSRTKVES